MGKTKKKIQRMRKWKKYRQRNTVPTKVKATRFTVIVMVDCMEEGVVKEMKMEMEESQQVVQYLLQHLLLHHSQWRVEDGMEHMKCNRVKATSYIATVEVICMEKERIMIMMMMMRMRMQFLRRQFWMRCMSGNKVIVLNCIVTVDLISMVMVIGTRGVLNRIKNKTGTRDKRQIYECD